MRTRFLNIVLFAGILPAMYAVAARAGCIPVQSLFTVREAAKIPFRQPADFVLTDDRILVLDDLNGRIAMLDFQGRTIGSIPLPAQDGDSWLGLGFGGADQIFLAASSVGKIIVLDLKGKVLLEFATGEGEEEVRPTGIAVSRGTCFVTDTGAHKIRSYTIDGKSQQTWGGLGDGPGRFGSPFRIVQDSLDRVIVSDVLNSRIQIFTPRGVQLLTFGEFGTSEGKLFRPAGLAVLEGDRILVSDNYFGSLQVFNPQGVYEGVLCRSDGRPLALENPTSIAVRGRTIFVLEMGGGLVSAFELGKR